MIRVLAHSIDRKNGRVARRRSRMGLAGLAGLALALGGCSVSLPIASLIGEKEPATTASVTARPVSPLSPELTAEDWRRARAALAVALDPTGNGAAAAWDNPDTGMKGAFLPVGGPFVKSDEICRAFLARLDVQGDRRDLQGAACRLSGGDWTVKDIQPWKRPL